MLEGDILAYFKNQDMANQALKNRESMLEPLSDFDMKSTVKSSMASSLREDQITKKSYEGGLVSLRLSNFKFLENKKKTIMVDTGTNEIYIKFLSPEEKKEWVQALQEHIDWVESTNT